MGRKAMSDFWKIIEYCRDVGSLSHPNPDVDAALREVDRLCATEPYKERGVDLEHALNLAEKRVYDWEQSGKK